MLSLLDKFDIVEIKNNTRLCDEDRQYCEGQQDLYSKVLKHYRNMLQELSEVQAKDSEFYKTISAENEYYSGNYTYKVYTHEFVDIKKEKFADTVKNVHNRFIEQIHDYFRNKYNVKIDKKEFEKYFTMECPKHPDRGYGYSYYNRMTDEEKEKYHASIKQYESEEANYLDSVINAEIDFNLVIDDIFVALGGFSFSEKVEQEIKENAKKAVRNNYNDKVRYTIKNGKISFDILYSSKDRWGSGYSMSLNKDGYMNVLRALTYFDSNGNMTAIYPRWIESFTGYTKYERDGIYGTHDTCKRKVTQFKYMKNGKWIVEFTDHSTVLKFANEFLGYVG